MSDRRNDPTVKTATMTIQLLGGFSISVDQEPIPEAQWKSRRARSLVKLLALSPGHRRHRDQIIDLLWPDSDLSAAANNFHQVLYAARRLLDPFLPGCLVLDDGFLSFFAGEAQSLSVDVDSFEAAVTRARSSHDPAAYQTAIDIYKGDLLPDDLYEEWTIQRRETLRETHKALLLDLAKLQEGRQEYLAGIDNLLRLLAVDPSHEEAHRGLMRLYALSGQRQQALRQYQALKDVLYREMEIEPVEESVQLYQNILAGRINPQAPQTAPAQPLRSTHNLPRQLTTLIGREKEINRVMGMVKERPLVTLTGPGGLGKTRLALAAAERMIPDVDTYMFPDGVWLIELAPLSDPQQVVRAVAEVLGLHEEPGRTVQDSLAHYLVNKRLLLVIDNCEHVIDACATLFLSLLRTSPGLKVLAASREPLGIPGEVILRLETLSIPEPGKEADLAHLEQVESVRLFVDRAKSVQPDFELTLQNAAAVVQICHRLEGIPLAIELAASRVASLELGQIAARLERTFRLLAADDRGVSERQRTLRATIDWSYNLLSAEEKLLLQRLSVFKGGWTLEAAEKVCAGAGLAEEDIANLLAQLVHKSMVVTTFTANYWLKDPLPGYAMRYRLLKTIHQYAQDILAPTETAAHWRDRHLDYYLELAETIEPKLRSGERLDRLYQLHLEEDNLLGALAWALDESPDIRGFEGARLVNALMFFLESTLFFVDTKAWLEKAEVKLDRENPEHRLALAKLLISLGIYFRNENKYLQAHRSFEESLQLFRECGDPLGIAMAHKWLGILYIDSDINLTTSHFESSQYILRGVGDKWYLADLYLQWGCTLNKPEDTVQKIYFEQESITLFQATGDRWGSFKALLILCGVYDSEGNLPKLMETNNAITTIFRELHARPFISTYPFQLGWIAYFLKNFAQMEAYSQESLPILHDLGQKSGIAYTTRLLTIAALRQGKIKPAALYFLDALKQSQALESDDYGILSCLALMVYIALAAGLTHDAMRLFGAFNTLFENSPKQLDNIDQLEFDRVMGLLPDLLAEPAFQAAWSDGRTLTLEQAIQEAQALGEELVKD